DRHNEASTVSGRACGLVVMFCLIALIYAWLPFVARGAETEATQRFVLQWGGQGSDEGEFDFPIGIAINPADEVFVTDLTNVRVQRLSAEGKFLAAFAVAPFPGGIALDRDEHIYVAHMGIPPSRYEEPRKRDKIAVYDRAGKLLRDWGKAGTGDSEFDM